jgi:hypothetical protein
MSKKTRAVIDLSTKNNFEACELLSALLGAGMAIRAKGYRLHIKKSSTKVNSSKSGRKIKEIS